MERVETQLTRGAVRMDRIETRLDAHNDLVNRRLINLDDKVSAMTFVNRRLAESVTKMIDDRE